jgi:DNA-binding beta-propeller fold protein YncE
VCLAAVLGDSLHRLSVLGGREGMPRSLGSVYSGSITRFLGGGFRGIESRAINVGVADGKASLCSGLAVSHDGCTLLATGCHGACDSVLRYTVSDGSAVPAAVHADAPVVLSRPHHIHVAGDGFVFVAEHGGNCVSVLSPDTMQVHVRIGVGVLSCPTGVCASAHAVVVTECPSGRALLFRRSDGSLVRRFGRRGVATASGGSDDGMSRPDVLATPLGVCFMQGDGRVAVADSGNDRVSVFRVDDGEFVRHVGVGVLESPNAVACSGFDELVVSDVGNLCIRVFGELGDLLMTFGRGYATAVAVHGTTVLGVRYGGRVCVVWL